ncbi:hypothetical protein [Nesterenkonia sp. NBAIMH1]|uniref:hypothetical protein n=1 Tax=Nesterenkonia sp. NBAIMH1 TaxID=2600320 RepID=UPI0011B51F5D|nr:hypothetical protein [Nesterenkonia sp. NBAIMH1]
MRTAAIATAQAYLTVALVLLALIVVIIACRRLHMRVQQSKILSQGLAASPRPAVHAGPITAS